MRLTGACRQSTIRMPSPESTYERAPMSTSRLRLGGIPGRRSLAGTVSSRRMWPKYGVVRSTDPLMLRPR